MAVRPQGALWPGQVPSSGLSHGECGVEPGVAGLVLADGALVAGAGAGGAGVPVVAGAEGPAEVFGALGLADDGEGGAAAVVGLVDGVPVDAGPELLVVVTAIASAERTARLAPLPRMPALRVRRRRRPAGRFLLRLLAVGARHHLGQGRVSALGRSHASRRARPVA
ncbi:hypothetical protein [Streptomyces sp. B27]|uniref:hypothetical protein n=1 Tax=Streptomyces sp. B27 TaxID=2485015 RepID=UPI000FDB5A38|nr:hypothetical protein [Streptomyces sp. B27]